jgi:methionyl-tRNA formyltransferase
MYENLNVKIIEAHTVASENDVNHCGEIIDINKEGIFVNTAKGTLIITKLQLPSRKPTVVKDMLNGNHPFKINSIFS